MTIKKGQHQGKIINQVEPGMHHVRILAGNTPFKDKRT